MGHHLRQAMRGLGALALEQAARGTAVDKYWSANALHGMRYSGLRVRRSVHRGTVDPFCGGEVGTSWGSIRPLPEPRELA